MGATKQSAINTSSTTPIGRVKNGVQSPSDMIKPVLRFDSTIGPKIRPRIIGANGTAARVSNKSPNLVCADGHVMRRINLNNGPWSDDNFNLDVF